MLKAIVNDKYTEAVLDSGSARNIVRHDFATEVRKTNAAIKLRTAGGNSVEVLGESPVKIQIGGKSIKCTALVVADLPKGLILGNEFLVQNNVVLDYHKGIVKLGNGPDAASVYFMQNHTNRSQADPSPHFVGTLEYLVEHDRLPYAEGEMAQGENSVQNPIKVSVAADYKLIPGAVSTISLMTDKPIHASLDQYSFEINTKLMYQKHLMVMSALKENEGGLEIEVVQSAYGVPPLFRNCTLGYLHKDRQEQDQLLLLYNEINNPKITSTEHDINTDLTGEQKEQLLSLLTEFTDIFANRPEDMGRTDLVQYHIDVQGATPVKRKPYRVSQKEREIIDEQINLMLKNGVIRVSHSPWASPIVLVRKPDGSIRFCIDYTKVNAVTKKTSYPFPNIDDILHHLAGAKFFTTLDLLSAYWQVGIKEECKEYTAFTAPGHGLFEFNVLPYGMVNAGSVFQELADRVFEGLIWREALVYLDDIIVYSNTFEEHLARLRRVFERIRKAGLTLKPSKCAYAKSQTKVLGHVISSEGIAPDQSKLIAIKKFPRPHNVKSVQSFLGLCNYYRKFVKDFSKIARPLYDITKSSGFQWSDSQEKAFSTLKEKLVSAPVLHRFDPSKDCELRTDACKSGLGAILLQTGEDNQQHPVAYASRSLTKAEQNYTVSELEALGIIWSLQYLRHLVYGRKTRIVSDHHTLCFLQTARNLTGRLARWAVKLSEYDHEIVYRSGKNHKDADCLSRYPVLDATPQDEESALDIPTFLMEADELIQHQQADNSIRLLTIALTNPLDPQITIGIAKRAKNFSLDDGVLYKKNATGIGKDKLLVMPREMIAEILYSHHAEPLFGHLGITKTLEKIKSRYYWDGLQKDVESFVKGCPDCQARKGSKMKPPGSLQPIPISTPFERIGIDLLGPFRRSTRGNTMIIVATDYATRYVEAAALPDGKATSVAKFMLENIITRHGAPRYILSDRGATFRSELVTNLLQLMGVTSHFTTSFHPSCNGLVERCNKTIADMLSLYVGTDQTDWDVHLPHVIFAYNTAIQDTTKMSPFHLVYGRFPILPTEATLMAPTNVDNCITIRERALAARSLAATHIKEKQQKDKARFDVRHRHLDFNPGDQVKLFTPLRKKGRSTKLLLKWGGPFTILRKVGPVDYEIQKGENTRSPRDIVHISRLLPYNDQWSGPICDLGQNAQGQHAQ